jgi:hypothetical protein
MPRKTKQSAAALADECPNRANHTPCPTGYLQRYEWAQEMLKTHGQVQCPGCELWAIWVPKSDA